MKIKSRRLELIKGVVQRRQMDLTVVMEHLSDMHNIGAVLRTCEAIGIHKVHLIPPSDTDMDKNLVLGKRTTAGARKWLDVYIHQGIEECINSLRPDFDQILCTALCNEAGSLYHTDFKISTAIIVGNEKEGVSQKAENLSDGNIIIPMQGMVQSLNVSVATSAILFEAMRQRIVAGSYSPTSGELTHTQKLLMDDYLKRHANQHKGRKAKMD